MKKTQDLTQAESATQNSDDEELARRQKLDELTAEGNEQSKLKTELEQVLKRMREPQKAMERDLKTTMQEQKRAESNLAKANKRLKDRRDEIVRVSGSAESEAAQRAQRLQDAEVRLQDERTKVDPIKQAVSESLQAYEEMEAAVANAQDSVKQAKHRLNGVEGRIRSLQSSSSSPVAVYGQKCSEVHKLVSSCNTDAAYHASSHVFNTSSFCFCRCRKPRERNFSKDQSWVRLAPISRLPLGKKSLPNLRSRLLVEVF